MRLTKKERLRNALCAAASILAFLGIWQLATMYSHLGELIPSPIQVLQYLFTVEKIGRKTFIQHSLVSLSRVLIAYSVACVVGVTLGLLMGWYPKIKAIFMPLFNIIRPIPPIAWTSLAILWFGLGEMPKWFIIFIAAFCNVVINAFDGARSVDMKLVGCAKMLGARDNQIFTRIVLPASVPYIFAGMQIALSNSWAAVVAAEMIRASEGFGMPVDFHYGNGMGTNPIQMMQALSAQVIRHKRVMKENCVIICSSICDGYFHDERWPYARELFDLFGHDYHQTLPDMASLGEYFATREDYIRKYRFAGAFHPYHGFSMMSCAHIAEMNTSAIYIVGAREPGIARAMGLKTRATFEEALEDACRKFVGATPNILALPKTFKLGAVHLCMKSGKEE